MRYKKIILALLLVILPVMLIPSPAEASQQPGHIFIALRALDFAPPELRQMLMENLDSYIAGATGPDMGLAAYPLREAMGFSHQGSLPHYHRSGQLIMNMMDLAETDRERAFTIGWLTHYAVDNSIHPLVNRFGGYYTGKIAPEGGRKRSKDRHVRLEIFEAAHVFGSYVNKASGLAAEMERYVVEPSAVPVVHIERAYLDTYVEGPWDRLRFTVPVPLRASYYRGAQLMNIATESFVTQAAGAKRSRVSVRRLTDYIIHNTLEEIPTKDEYDLLMEPLKITGVDLAAGNREGKDVEILQVAYRINDLRLHKVFAAEWENCLSTALQQITYLFEVLSWEPVEFYLDDLNLDTGNLEEWGHNLEGDFFPGNPEIENLLVTCSIVDAEGKQLSPLPGEGDFIPLASLDEKVWGGKAGDGILEVQLLPGGIGPYQVEVTIEYSSEATKEPYGVEDSWRGQLGAEDPGKTVYWKGDFTVESYTGMEINGISTWQGSGEPIPLVLSVKKNPESIEVFHVQIDDGYFFNRGSLFLLTAPQVVKFEFDNFTSMSDAMGSLYSVDLPANDEDDIPEWLKRAVNNIEFPADIAVIEFSLLTVGGVSGDEYMRFVGILNADWTGAVGTFEAGYNGYGKDITGTWFAH